MPQMGAQPGVCSIHYNYPPTSLAVRILPIILSIPYIARAPTVYEICCMLSRTAAVHGPSIAAHPTGFQAKVCLAQGWVFTQHWRIV